jgi:hypothetical protein
MRRQRTLVLPTGRAPFPHPPAIIPVPVFLVPTRIALPEMPLLIIVPLHDRRTETGLDERHAGEIP